MWPMQFAYNLNIWITVLVFVFCSVTSAFLFVKEFEKFEDWPYKCFVGCWCSIFCILVFNFLIKVQSFRNTVRRMISMCTFQDLFVENLELKWQNLCELGIFEPLIYLKSFLLVDMRKQWHLLICRQVFAANFLFWWAIIQPLLFLKFKNHWVYSTIVLQRYYVY